METGVNGLKPTDIVRQSAMIHPHWKSKDHLEYLINDEFIEENLAIGAVAWCVIAGIIQR